MTAAVGVRRVVRLVRHVGEAPPTRCEWGCLVEADDSGVVVRIAEADELDGVDLDAAARSGHEALLQRVPRVLRSAVRSEVGVVRTATVERRYALATCGGVVLALGASDPVVPWHGTATPADVDPASPVALGPSAVLSLVAGLLELTPSAGLPDGISVRAARRSPYPPHEAPEGLDRGDAWWATNVERWQRPLRTTRAGRGEYEVRAALPEVAGVPAVWVESLLSLDTDGRWWQASLSIAGRRWVTEPQSLELRPHDLLGRATGRLGSPQPALDRDPVDGESFGWAPGLLTDVPAGALGIGRPT
ncbi:MAG: hypothetical protein HOV94_26630 [Saccharothrix sp.]|nr:hypothetical protein [Saccharothrix sp.]